MSSDFPSQVLSTGPPILVPVQQVTGQRSRWLVAGVLILRTLAGNLLVKLLCEHVVPLCFIHYSFLAPTVRVTNMHVALRDLESSDDRIFLHLNLER